MSLLSICQDAASDLGLRQPAAIVGSTDLTAQKLFRFANSGGKQLARYHDWQALTVEQTFTTLAQVVQTDALDPDDYDRMIYNPEVWNRSQDLRYAGPTPQRVWQQLQTGIVSGGLVGWWRIKGGQLNIYPAPSAGETLAFEYVSKRWARSSGGTEQEKFEADTDTTVLDEDLLTLEIIWRFRHSRGFAQYAEDMATCEREKEKAASRDRGTGRIRPDSDNAADWPPSPTWVGTIGA
jgi:hypothetical protein